MSTESVHEATGAYVADALTARERAAFEAHLATCRPCAEEVRELAATAALLGRAVAVRPPPEMRDAVMHRIRELGAEPAAAGGPGAAAGEPYEHSVRTPDPDTGGAPGGDPSGTHGGAPGGDTGTAAVRQARPGRSRLRWALAACLVAVAGLGGVAVWQAEQAGTARQEARAAQARAAATAEVLTAPDARPTTGRLPDGGTATVVVSREQDKAVFVADGMAAPPAGRVYQLWFADPAGAMHPAGLMDPARPGAPELMAGSVRGATAVGVTLEPSGGSAAPTTEPLVVLALPAA
ncbi:anti-sigma factor domain-containing protein [Streptomyces sp. NPDC058655]|uniref:anti-sigma factor n=1 Tax=Streptomyces sp. NPDC058655 TaxID=3346577 RepID=UPI00364C340F